MDYRFRYRRRRASPEEQAGARARQKDTLQRMRGLAIGMSIPTSMAAGPLVGWLIGAWIDRAAGTAYWTPIMIVVATAAALKLVIDMLAALSRMK